MGGLDTSICVGDRHVDRAGRGSLLRMAEVVHTLENGARGLCEDSTERTEPDERWSRQDDEQEDQRYRGGGKQEWVFSAVGRTQHTPCLVFISPEHQL